MTSTNRCPDCDAALPEGVTCQDHFHQMLYWEAEDFESAGRVHHLMVLCYHLQHPSLISPAGLEAMKALLADFIERGITPAEVRRRDRKIRDSGNRTFRFVGEPASYDSPVAWTMTAADVVAGGAEHYADNVETWARTVLAALQAASALLPSTRTDNGHTGL